MDVTALVEPDRVHKTVYTDQQIFDARDGAASGSASGSTAATSRRCRSPATTTRCTIGRQPMIMVRQPDGSVQVLYNRCPHRGVQLVGNLQGQHRQRASSAPTTPGASTSTAACARSRSPRATRARA